MPWRQTRDPYRIWVSEIMLQQTQVATVIPYYERFIARFPTVTALAAAELEAVLQLWSGLGYYSRARNLHRGAQTVAVRHGGIVPRTPQELSELPGIGAYTAGAILSIAFDLPEPLVDGNVARVLARVRQLDGDWRTSSGKKVMWDAARQLVAHCGDACVSPGDFNQALMELGATICTPRAPDCALCPVASACLARGTGTQADYPRIAPKRAVPTWHLRAWLVEDARGRLLLVRRAAHGLFGGLWELPTERAAEQSDEITAFAQFTHVLTHRTLKIAACRTRKTTLAGRRCVTASFPCWSGNYEEHRWLAPHEALAGKVALASIQQKILRAFAAAPCANSRIRLFSSTNH